MKNICRIITQLAVFCLIIFFSIVTTAFCDLTSILIGPGGTKYETYSATGVLESTQIESSRWTINGKEVYSEDKTTKSNFNIELNKAGKYENKSTKKETSEKSISRINQGEKKGELKSTKKESSSWKVDGKEAYSKDKTNKTNFTIERNESGKYKNTYTKKEKSEKTILGVSQKKSKKEGEIQWGKGGYRADTYYKDEKGVLRNGLGEKATKKDKNAYEKATNPSTKDKIKKKIKDNTSIKIDEKTYWDEEDALVKEKKEFENILGTDADASVTFEALGYSTSAKRQIECKGGDCGVEYAVNAEAVVARVEGEVETKFLEDSPFLSPIESKTTGSLEIVAEAESKVAAKFGRDGAKLEAGVEGFAGGRAKVEQELKTDLFGLGIKLDVNAQASYGIGGEAKGNFEVSLTKIKLGGKLAGTLGLGAGAGANLEIDISKWTAPIRDVISFFSGNDEVEENGNNGNGNNGNNEKPIKHDDKNGAGTRLKPITPLPSVIPLPEVTKLPPVKTIPKPRKLSPIKPLPKPKKLPW